MKKILVVDDDKPLRGAISLALRRQGYEVLDAADVAVGLALAIEHKPSLVLSDVNMAGGNGFELLKELRARPETLAIPVIFMTGQPQKADARFSMDQGADDYLAKPFSMDELLAAVRARLQRQAGINQASEAKSQTERLMAEEKLRLLTSALEAAANSITITNSQGRILWVNSAFSKLTGWFADEVIGQDLRILKSGRHPPKFYADLWGTITAGKAWHGELVNKRKDGSLYREEMTITPVCDANGAIQNFIAIKLDITERKRVEEALRDSEEKFRQLAANVSDVFWMTSPDSQQMHYVSPAYEQIWGRSTESLYAHPHEWVEAILPEERERVLAVFGGLMTNEPEVSVEYRIARPDGTVRWVHDRGFQVRDAAGKLVRLTGIASDITERKRLESQLSQSQKLETVGQLAAGIAHEINTPTQYVGDNTRFVKESFAAISKVLQSHNELLAAVKNNAVTPELLARADDILVTSDLDYLCLQIPSALAETLEGVERITKIVRAMKEFSHPGSKEKTPADLNKAIESTVTVAHNEWKYVADLKLDLDSDLPLVPCFLGEFNQCILNLIVNAAHAIGDVVRNKPGTKGKITIQTRHDENEFEVRVADTGTGIPESARPKIFEQFFTTKEVGKGTGQGLSMVYASIVKRHGGTVTFETEVGKGTTFIIRLPLKPKAAPEKNSARPERLAA
jgi:PAS domain S-box-containing protein